MSDQQECSICQFVSPGLPFRECDLCTVKYHEICYFQNKPRSEINCDACAHVMEQNLGKKKKMEPVCFICNKSDGVLKDIEDDKFVHVLCALTSKNIMIESYKQFKICQSPQLPVDRCKQCSKMSSHLVQCQFCQYKAHKQCLPSQQLYVGQDLSGNLKYGHNLLNFLLSSGYESQILFLVLKCQKSWTKRPEKKFKRLAVCQKEVSKYAWCFCGHPQLNNEQFNPSIICDGCNRYCHQNCTGIKNPKKVKQYFCTGCKLKDEYKKLSKFSDNIQEAVRLQEIQYEISDLRYLDAFPFIYSDKMKKNLSNQLNQVVLYLAVKAIESMATPNNSQDFQVQDFYELLRMILDERDNVAKNQKQLWEDYRQFINKKDSSRMVSFYYLQPPQFQGITKISQFSSLKQKLGTSLKRITQLLQSKQLSFQIPEIVNQIIQTRKFTRQYPQLRKLIQNNLKGNLLFSFFVFKCSSTYENKIIQTLLNHFFLKTKITNQQLVQLNVIKRKRCPNFDTQEAWILLTQSIKISFPIKQDQQGLYIHKMIKQQSKEQNNKLTKQQEAARILSKILQNRTYNPKLYLALKKKVQNLPIQPTLTERQNKIKVFYQWSLITKKVHFGMEKKRISISSIIQLDRIIKKCEFPENEIKQKIQDYHNQIKGVIKITRKLQSLNKIQNKLPMLQLQQFIFKPTLTDLYSVINKLKKPKFEEIWGDLERFQLEQYVRNAENLRERLRICLQMPDMFNPEQYSKDKEPTRFQNEQIITLKQDLIESSVIAIDPYQFFQILGLVNEAEIRYKNMKWLEQKKSQQKNQKQLVQNVSMLIQVIKKQNKKFNQCKLKDILYNDELLKLLEVKMKQDENKMLYFQKHVKRNKKWIEDIQKLGNGGIKYLSLEQLCCLQFKVKTSIFDHSKILEQILIPLKNQCIEARRYLQQIIPYGKKMLHYVDLSQDKNIFSPDNEFFKKVKGLVVKDYCLRLYQRDCLSLKNLIFFQHRVKSSRHINEIKVLIIQFEKIYRSFSPYLHELTLVWEMILSIGQKISEKFYEEEFKESQISTYEKKTKKMLKLILYMANVGGDNEYKRMAQKIKKKFCRKNFDSDMIQNDS